MKIIDQADPAKITLELSGEELCVLFSTAAELLNGPLQLDNQDWETHIGWPRTTARKLVDDLEPAVERFTSTV